MRNGRTLLLSWFPKRTSPRSRASLHIGVSMGEAVRTVPSWRQQGGRPAAVARIALAALLFAVAPATVQAIPSSHVEEFNTTTFKDAANTTADWNTASGKLQLFTFPFLLGSYDTPDNAWGVAVSGTVAYVADGSSGLQILNVSNPASPTLLGSYDTPGFAFGVAISGTVAYVADANSGLQILNVSNPGSPTLLGSYAMGNARGVAVSGTRAYVTDAFSGVKILNVSNPASPTLHVPDPHARERIHADDTPPEP